jgi:heme exporter protein A
VGDSQASICLENAAIVRGGRFVLRNFSLQANAGDIIWIRGANGVGKSTLLRAIAGLLALSAGSLAINGTLALTDDMIGLDGDRSLEDALRFWAKLDGAGPAQLEAALQALDLVGLAEIPVRMLSAGQKRRGALARMIACGAQIWLLDEPYNGLDQANVARLDAVVQRHAGTGGISLIASHIAPTISVTQSLSLDQKAVAA